MSSSLLLQNQTAEEALVAYAAEYGFSLWVHGTILTVRKSFPAGDVGAFGMAEAEAGVLLSLIKQTEAGSIWGTDGLSVGGMSAIRSGEFKLNKSGCSKRSLAKLVKLGAFVR